MTGIEGSPTPGDSAADVAAEFAIVGGSPSAVELAAVTAVLTAAVEEIDAEKPLDEAPGASAWQRSQRGVRAPLYPGKGAWRGFSG